MRGSKQDLPVTHESPKGTLKQIEWGGMTVEMGDIRQSEDFAPFFRGLSDDRCQCPHCGYVVKGSLRYRFADREEVYRGCVNKTFRYFGITQHFPENQTICARRGT